jgi:hypothetical protein
MNWFQRVGSSFLLAGQVTLHLLRGRIHRRNTLEQLAAVGLESLLIVLITAVVISGVFTIQLAREFINFGASSLIGGVLAIALARELTPVVTAVILAGRVGSAFAAELGTMKVTEQIDALYLLRTDPVDYLVIPRVVAAGLMLPVLTILSLLTGLVGGDDHLRVGLQHSFHGVSHLGSESPGPLGLDRLLFEGDGVWVSDRHCRLQLGPFHQRGRQGGGALHHRCCGDGVAGGVCYQLSDLLAGVSGPGNCPQPRLLATQKGKGRR